jgi:hypothetical protein
MPEADKLFSVLLSGRNSRFRAARVGSSSFSFASSSSGFEDEHENEDEDDL